MNTSSPITKGFFVTYEGSKIIKHGHFDGCISTPYDLKVFKTVEQLNSFIEELQGSGGVKKPSKNSKLHG